ncbi:hypothetical protein A3Q56_02908 [Intoshia linei]|uniref:Uncharacterized protein n=1 Tax=Intoshia linei TaxID=1819745 RepID=A0A177B505_9BILA|nr:hypothetical protein A3Q56_02908 [Intoshia linei]
MEGNYPYLALAIDSTSLKVFRPHGIERGCNHDNSSSLCFLSQKGFLGSEHDLSAFKRIYINYLDYLKKLPPEEISLNIDSRWGVVLDSGYLGNSCETPGLRKFAMNRPSLVKLDEIHYQSELASKHFDICVLLTNEIIQRSGLCENGTHFELKLITRNKREQDEKLLKSKQESTNYSNRKKMRPKDSDCSFSTSCTSYSIT